MRRNVLEALKKAADEGRTPIAQGRLKPLKGANKAKIDMLQTLAEDHDSGVTMIENGRSKLYQLSIDSDSNPPTP